MDIADLVWNRACNLGGDYVPTSPGDIALFNILAFHGPSMNGGIAHAFEVVGTSAASDAARGYRFLDAPELAELVDEALALAAPGIGDDGQFDTLALEEEAAETLDALDGRLPDDSDLESLFRTYLAGHPDQFEPLD